MKNNLSEFRGGILADDIGLGKTLEMLGCIASNRPPLEVFKFYILYIDVGRSYTYNF